MPPLHHPPFVVIVRPLAEGGNIGHVYIPQDDVVYGGTAIAFLCHQGQDMEVLTCLSGEEYIEKRSLTSSCLA